jgi:protein phosphatase
MRLEIPELALVLLIGPSGAGKSTFARRHFLSHEGVSPDAFKLLYYLVEIRLRRGLLTVIDATNVAPEDRKGLIALAKKHHCFAVGIVFNLPDSICIERNLQRPDRSFGANVIYRQKQLLRKGRRTPETRRISLLVRS